MGKNFRKKEAHKKEARTYRANVKESLARAGNRTGKGRTIDADYRSSNFEVRAQKWMRSKMWVEAEEFFKQKIPMDSDYLSTPKSSTSLHTSGTETREATYTCYPIHEWIRAGAPLSVVKVLVEKCKGSIHYQDSNGMSPLILALQTEIEGNGARKHRGTGLVKVGNEEGTRSVIKFLRGYHDVDMKHLDAQHRAMLQNLENDRDLFDTQQSAPIAVLGAPVALGASAAVQADCEGGWLGSNKPPGLAPHLLPLPPPPPPPPPPTGTMTTISPLLPPPSINPQPPPSAKRQRLQGPGDTFMEIHGFTDPVALAAGMMAPPPVNIPIDPQYHELESLKALQNSMVLQQKAREENSSFIDALNRNEALNDLCEEKDKALRVAGAVLAEQLKKIAELERECEEKVERLRNVASMQQDLSVLQERLRVSEAKSKKAEAAQKLSQNVIFETVKNKTQTETKLNNRIDAITEEHSKEMAKQKAKSAAETVSATELIINLINSENRGNAFQNVGANIDDLRWDRSKVRELISGGNVDNSETWRRMNEAMEEARKLDGEVTVKSEGDTEGLLVSGTVQVKTEKGDSTGGQQKPEAEVSLVGVKQEPGLQAFVSDEGKTEEESEDESDDEI